MGWLDDIASAVGHTIQSLADDVGYDIHALDNLVGDLAGSGIDVLSAAAKIGMAPVSFLKAVIGVLSGDPHAQLLHYVQTPGLWVGEPAAQMSGHWQTMFAHHSNTKQQIDTEFNQIFSEGGSFAYSGPAADTLFTTHTNYQNYFNSLIDHTQTQQTRYTTLHGHMQTFLADVHSTVYNLPAPVAAVGVVTIDSAADVDPAIQFMLSLIGLDATGMAIALPWPGVDIPIEAILLAILIILVIILVLVALFVAVKDAVTTHTAEQNTTTTPTPQPAPTPDPKPWPWVDPVPPWFPKDDPDCIQDIAQVKAVFPDVQAGLIAYLTCLQPKMSPKEVIDLFTLWTSEGMTQQDINNFLERITNLRLDPSQNPPTRDQIIAFLRNHKQDIPDIWAKYQQVQNIPGIDQILKDMITSPNNKDGSPGTGYRGSYFELNWIVNRQKTNGDVAAVEQFVNGQHGADVTLKNGTLVDTKSYMWSKQSPGFIKAVIIPEIRKQLERYRTKPPFTGHPVVYVFDSAGGKIPASIQKIFDDEKALGLNVTVQYWPNPNP